MDYLTTFTGKSGRLLRGTASRLWGLGGGGGGEEARQVRFEDYLREPAPGDPDCGPVEHPPPSLASPEGPGECPLSSLRADGRTDGDGDRGRGPGVGDRGRRGQAGVRAPQARSCPSCPRDGRHRLVPGSGVGSFLSSASSEQL